MSRLPSSPTEIPARPVAARATMPSRGERPGNDGAAGSPGECRSTNSTASPGSVWGRQPIPVTSPTGRRTVGSGDTLIADSDTASAQRRALRERARHRSCRPSPRVPPPVERPPGTLHIRPGMLPVRHHGIATGALDRQISAAMTRLAPLARRWGFALVWVSLPFTAGPSFADALDPRSRPVQLVATVGLWLLLGRHAGCGAGAPPRLAHDRCASSLRHRCSAPAGRPWSDPTAPPPRRRSPWP